MNSENVKRYDLRARAAGNGKLGWTMTNCPDGDYVTFSDYQALEQKFKDRTDSMIIHKGMALACSSSVKEAFRALEEQLKEARAANEWRPIASAPKDGSQFLIWTNRLGFAAVRHDVEDPMPTDIVPSGHHLQVDDGKHGPYSIRGDYPTHWMPLPPQPEASAENGRAA